MQACSSVPRVCGLSASFLQLSRHCVRVAEYCARTDEGTLATHASYFSMKSSHATTPILAPADAVCGAALAGEDDAVPVPVPLAGADETVFVLAVELEFSVLLHARTSKNENKQKAKSMLLNIVSPVIRERVGTLVLVDLRHSTRPTATLGKESFQT